SLARNDGKNLIRQERTDQIRQISFWLGDALAYASATEAEPDGLVIHEAGPSRITFTSALPVEGVTGAGTVSAVTLVLGEECWTGKNEGQEGVLRRCVQSPSVDSTGAAQPLCDYGSSGCESKFDDFIVAREVNDTRALFTYYFDDTSGLDPSHSVATEHLGNVIAVELKVTVAGVEADDRTEATVFKRYSINKWRRS
ncbi:MAG: hypothetical protein LBG11_09625, partial [Bifidobacteriaceae bacterium]|nr:hypothetical protein [Bifidobacteriaceae bacterium]